MTQNDIIVSDSGNGNGNIAIFYGYGGGNFTLLRKDLCDWFQCESAISGDL